MGNRRNIGMIKAAPNLVNVCIDTNMQGEIAGRFYQCYKKEFTEFHNVIQLLSEMEKLFDELHFPEASTQVRSFDKKRMEEERPKERLAQRPKQVLEREVLLEQRGKKATFLVYVQYRQNSTWQGEVFNLKEEVCQGFSSALDFIKIISNASNC